MTQPNETRSAATPSLPFGVEWRYLHGGRLAHAVDHIVHLGVSACGLVEVWGEWFGTGSQVEYERAEQLPRCRRCARAVIESWAGW